MTSPYVARLDQQIRAVTAEVQDLQVRLSRMRSAASAARLPAQRLAANARIREVLRALDAKQKQLADLRNQRAAWLAKHPTVTPPPTMPAKMPPTTTPARQLREGGAPLRPPLVQPPIDPYRSGVTLATAPRAQRYYEGQLRTTAASDPRLNAYYRQRLAYVQSVLRAAAPGRRVRTDIQAEVARLRRLAAAAKARRDYAMNQRLQQQLELMEQQMRVSAVSAEWTPTAPESYVAPAMPANEVVATPASTALTFTQAREATLAPAAAAAKEIEDGEHPLESEVDAGIEEKPWYVRYALPLALAAAAGIGLAVYGKKGKGAGHFKLLRHGRASSHSTHAAK